MKTPVPEALQPMKNGSATITDDESSTGGSEASEAASPAPTLRIPTSSRSIFAILFAAGALVLAFTFMTVHRLDPAELATQSGAVRTHFSINYWLDHGYFRSFGLLVRPSGPTTFNYYVSSTGGHLVSGFLVEKIYSSITGHPSWRLLAIHNQVMTLLVASMLGLLGFRLARRFGIRPLHALVLALSLEVVHFTFPDNLLLYFEMNGRPYFLFFAIVFLLIEERCLERRSRRAVIAQAVAAFLLTYMEYVAGAMFITSFVMASFVLSRDRPLRRMILTAIVPMLLAFGVYGLQRTLVRAHDVPTGGNSFLFRTGLDGSSQYYGDHLDIAFGRDLARGNFPQNRPYLLQWQWLFFAGTTAVVLVVIMAMRAGVPTIGTVSMLSLLGTYLLYAALFSQAIMIHPYLFDILLFTPLILALFVLVPSIIESRTEGRGVAVAVVFFLAAWVSMVQLRHYAMIYPRPPDAAALPAEPTFQWCWIGAPVAISMQIDGGRGRDDTPRKNVLFSEDSA